MSGHGTGARGEWLELLELEGGMGMGFEDRMVDRFAAGGGLRMNVEVRMGDSGVILGSSVHVVELTDTALRGGTSIWLLISDVIRGDEIRIPSNLTLGESIGEDNCGASSKTQRKKKKRVSMYYDRTMAVLK
jgi:hypothetical protein